MDILQGRAKEPSDELLDFVRAAATAEGDMRRELRNRASRRVRRRIVRLSALGQLLAGRRR